MNLKFRHKILLSACAVVVLAFALFTLYNDYLQRNTIGQNIEASVQQAGALTASSVQNWMSGRILVLENLAQDIALQGTDANVAGLVDQPSYTRNFLFTYLGQADGVFTQRPFVELPDGFDPRQRPWYGAAASAGHTVLTPPYQGTVGGLMMSIVTPVRSKASGELLGVAGGDLSLDTLVDIINAVDFGGIGHAFLADRDGQVIVSP
ncbi:cache domain-containing protein, partial [Pseudomonas guariconensis]